MKVNLLKHTQFSCYAVATVSVALALGITLVLKPYIEPALFALFYAAVAISAWYGSWRGGLLATVLSILAVSYFLTSPLHKLLPLTIFIGVTLLMSYLNSELHSAKRRVQANLRTLEASEENYHRLAENVPQLVWMTAADGFVQYLNQRWYDYTGLIPKECLGWEWQVAIHPEDLPYTQKKWKEGLATGNTVELEYRLRRFDGVYRWFMVRAVPLRDSSAEIIKWFGTCTDIHDRKQAQEVLLKNQERLTFLANANSILASNLDYEATIANITRLAVPFLADICVVDLLHEDESPQRVAVTHVDPTKEELMYELARRYPSLQNENSPLKLLLRHRQSILFPEIPESQVLNYALDAEHLRLIREVGEPCSSMVVPLIARGRILGVISFGTTAHSGRHYNSDDLTLAEDLADRIALALDNARLYREAQQAESKKDSVVALLDALLASAPIGFAFFDCQRRYIRLNQALATINNLPSSAHLGKTVWETMAPNLAPIVDSRIEQVLATGEPILNVEEIGETLAASNEKLCGLSSYYPVRSESGQILGVGVAILDISDRKRAEEALYQREQAFRALVENLPDIISRLDRELRHLYVSPSIEQVTGMPPDAFLGKTNLELGLPPELCAEWEEKVQTVFSTGNIGAIEFQFPSSNGIRYYQSQLVPEYSLDGSILSVLCIARDLTEYRRAEQEKIQLLEQLASKQKLLETVLQQMPAGVVVAEAPSGRFLLANDQVQQILPGALLNMQGLDEYIAPLYQSFYPDGRSYKPEKLPLARSLLTGEKVRSEEITVISFDGTSKILLTDSTPIRNSQGEIEAAVLTFYDITDRKLAEEALRENEQRLKLALETAKLGCWQLDLKTNKLSCSHQCKANFGLPPSANFSYQALYEAIHPNDRDRVRQTIRQAIENHVDYETEYRIFWPDGSLHWIGVRGRAFYDSDGNPLRSIGVTLDITAKKEAQAQQELLLEREQAARAEAEKANRIKDEFLAVLSHELRSPLNPILGWSSLLLSCKLDETATKHALEIIERNAKLQTQLIEDLLDVSHILRGQLNLSISPVNLATTIEAGLETVRLAAEAKAIDLKFLLNGEQKQFPISNSYLVNTKILVLGDENRLQQVIWNLLSNAVKFTQEGRKVEIRLDLVNAEDTDRESQLPSPQYAQIQVSDTGKGITADFLPYVFDYFRQADSSSTRKFGGLGLGLAIVRHLVELHGGTVWAESAGEEQGATFTVRLPLIATDIETNDNNPAFPQLFTLNGVQVLAVDDEEDMRDYICFLLKQSGAEVSVASSALEALEILQKIKPDIIVSDIGMPNFDGYMLLREVRSLPAEEGGEIPAIALTAYPGEFDRRQAIAAGFQMHVSKPIQPNNLIAAISSLLEKKVR